jgi:hypothetical protein
MLFLKNLVYVIQNLFVAFAFPKSCQLSLGQCCRSSENQMTEHKQKGINEGKIEAPRRAVGKLHGLVEGGGHWPREAWVFFFFFSFFKNSLAMQSSLAPDSLSYCFSL